MRKKKLPEIKDLFDEEDLLHKKLKKALDFTYEPGGAAPEFLKEMTIRYKKKQQTPKPKRIAQFTDIIWAEVEPTLPSKMSIPILDDGATDETIRVNGEASLIEIYGREIKSYTFDITEEGSEFILSEKEPISELSKSFWNDLKNKKIN